MIIVDSDGAHGALTEYLNQVSHNHADVIPLAVPSGWETILMPSTVNAENNRCLTLVLSGADLNRTLNRPDSGAASA
jgi:hypothetical protein